MKLAFGVRLSLPESTKEVEYTQHYPLCIVVLLFFVGTWNMKGRMVNHIQEIIRTGK